jgi:hypothetical protein
MRVDAYEGRIKRLVLAEDKGTLSFEQLQYSFESSANWLELQNEKSELTKLFKHELLYDEQQNRRLNMDRLLLLGIAMCRGEDNLKARVLFDIM